MSQPAPPLGGGAWCTPATLSASPSFSGSLPISHSNEDLLSFLAGRPDASSPLGGGLASRARGAHDAMGGAPFEMKMWGSCSKEY